MCLGWHGLSRQLRGPIGSSVVNGQGRGRKYHFGVGQVCLMVDQFIKELFEWNRGVSGMKGSNYLLVGGTKAASAVDEQIFITMRSTERGKFVGYGFNL